MDERPLCGPLGELPHRIHVILQVQPLTFYQRLSTDRHKESDGKTRLLFTQKLFFFCLMHVEDRRTIYVLQKRNVDDWWSCLIRGSQLEDSGTSTIQRVFFLGRLLHAVGAEISRTQLNEPWDPLVEDVLPSEIRDLYGSIFGIEFGQRRSFEDLEAHDVHRCFQHSEILKGEPFPSMLEWYRQITTDLPTSLPDWCQCIPPCLLRNLGVHSLDFMTAIICRTRKRCPSLCNDAACFPLILSSYGSYPRRTNHALHDWTGSNDGERWYRSFLYTFQSVKEPAMSLLAVAVLLCIPAYRNNFIAGSHRASVDPLMDLLPFFAGQTRPERGLILEKTTFSAIRVLIDDSSPESNQEEHRYLSEILTFALGRNSTTLGCFEGTLDHYWMDRIHHFADYKQALQSSISALGIARHQQCGLSLSRMISSATLRGHIDNEHTQIQRPNHLTLLSHSMNDGQNRRRAPIHAFRVVFLGSAGVGKSELINRLFYKRYSDQYDPTIEDDYHPMIEHHGVTCRLDITDTGGQSPYEEMEQMLPSTQRERKDAHVVVLVYDITSKTSFREVALIFDPKEYSQDASVILVGSKCDKEEEQRQVRPREGPELAHQLGGSFLEVSARTGDGIDEALEHLMNALLEQIHAGSNDTTEGHSGTSRRSFWRSIFLWIFCVRDEL